MSDFLAKVMEVKTREVAALKRSKQAAQFKRQALVMPLPPSFHDALRVPRAEYAVIGEIKRASPSRGDIRPDLDAAAQAKKYEELGISAISVLTDSNWFKGRYEDMMAAAQVTALPILCKDFIIDPVQIYRARAYGASAVLLITSLLDDAHLQALIRVAHSLSLDPFIETHSPEDIRRAVTNDTCRVVGVNARNLRTLDVDLGIPRRLGHRIPDRVVRVAESGIHSHESLVSLAEAGFDAFLVGEYLSGADDLEAAFHRLMHGDDTASADP